MAQPDVTSDALLETIATLALEIARTCPDCAESATRIASLAGEIRGASVDRGSVKDAIDYETADTDLSDIQARTTAEAVVKAARGAD